MSELPDGQLPANELPADVSQLLTEMSTVIDLSDMDKASPDASYVPGLHNVIANSGTEEL